MSGGSSYSGYYFAHVDQYGNEVFSDYASTMTINVTINGSSSQVLIRAQQGRFDISSLKFDNPSRAPISITIETNGVKKF